MKKRHPEERPPVTVPDSRADAIQRAFEEYTADKSSASHPLRRFSLLFNDSRTLRLLQTAQVARRSPGYQGSTTGVFSPSQHYVKLDITSVQPALAWIDDSVAVHFRIENRLLSPTSGVVTADVTQGIGASIAGVGLSKAVQVPQLQPGQVFNGVIVVEHWRAAPSFVKPGVHNVWVQYWVEDPDGTISVVFGPLGPNQIVKTFSSPAIAGHDIDVYPKCKPDGPDFIEVSSFSIAPDGVITDASGKILAPGQKVTLKWSVSSGGFPPATTRVSCAIMHT